MEAPTTLVYMGAGWDCSFVSHPDLPKYSRYIGVDAMPKQPHYEPGMRGYPYQERLFSVLSDRLGQPLRHDRDARKLFFPAGVEYWYSRDLRTEAVDSDLPAQYDILVGGYEPPDRYVEGRRIFRTSITCLYYEGETMIKYWDSDEECFRHPPSEPPSDDSEPPSDDSEPPSDDSD